MANQKLWFTIGLVVLVVLGFGLRTAWSEDVANVGDEYLLAESDAYYHKHAADIIQETWEHPDRDPMLNYPIGGPNPNPPMFEWTLAAGGELASPFFGGDTDQATWWWTAYAPAVLGALTIIPITLAGAALFGPWAGFMGGFFLATSPTHIDRTNLGFSDHDAMVVFFASIFLWGMVRLLQRFRTTGTGLEGYMTWIRGANGARGRGHALVAAAAITGVALTWKGFPYLYGVLALYLGIAMIVASWRRKDPITHWAPILTVMGVPLLLALPSYISLFHWYRPALFIGLGSLIVAVVFHKMRAYPPVVTVPVLALVGLVGAGIAFLVIPSVAYALFYSLVYFKGTTLYQTIAEAHPASFSDLSFAIGPFPFFLYMGGIMFLLYQATTKKSTALWFVLTLTAVEFYMAGSAVRFIFNLTAGMALVAGIATWATARWLRFDKIQSATKGGFSWRNFRRNVGAAQWIGVPLVALLVIMPNLWVGVDAATPFAYEEEHVADSYAALDELVNRLADEHDLSAEDRQAVVSLANTERSHDTFVLGLQDMRITNNLPTAFVEELSEQSEPHFEAIELYRKRLGGFGEFYISDGWVETLKFLKDRDAAIENPAERPAVLSWWDYGHWTISISDHPAVADNFQNGFFFSANFLTETDQTKAVQLLAARVARAHPAEVEQALDEQGVTDAADIAMRWNNEEFVTAPLDHEESVQLVERVSELTDTRIGYLAVDNRMMPIDDPRTPGIESNSIFYAPILLADKDSDDYIPIMFQDTRSGVRITVDEYNRLSASPTFDPNVYRQILVYQPQFFESMFYRGFWGSPVRAPVEFSGQTFPNPVTPDQYPVVYEQGMAIGAQEFTGSALTNYILPGLGLENWRLIHSNTEVRLLEYYAGAKVSGQVTFEGEPIEGARVVAFDDAGDIVYGMQPEFWAQTGYTADDLDIPHASVLTDADGNYEVRAPFGDAVSIVVLPPDAVDATPMAEEVLSISREQAQTSAELTVDVAVEPSILEGTAYHDVDNDGTYDETVDEAAAGITVTFNGDLNTTTDADGMYRIEVMPGNYGVTAENDALEDVFVDEIQAVGGETVTTDLPMRGKRATVDATVVDAQDDPVEEFALTLTPTEDSTPMGDEANGFSDGNGTLDVRVRPGTYEAAGNVTTADGAFLVLDTIEVVSGAASVEGTTLTVDVGATDVVLRITLKQG